MSSPQTLEAAYRARPWREAPPEEEPPHVPSPCLECGVAPVAPRRLFCPEHQSAEWNLDVELESAYRARAVLRGMQIPVYLRRRLIEMHDGEGLTFNEIADYLNAIGTHTPKGLPWSRPRVHAAYRTAVQSNWHARWAWRPTAAQRMHAPNPL